MKKLNLIIVILICFLFQNANSAETTNFFHQNSIFQINGEQIFDTPAWKINLDAPIRASAAFDSNSLYIGTAKGVFYAINQADGKIIWQFNTGSAIHSTAAFDNGKLYFTDNKQTLYCLNARDGKLLWSVNFEKRLPYLWKYDYFYSSPVIVNNNLLVGGDDGYLYNFDKAKGKLIWKYKAGSVIRATPMIDGNSVYFGDCDGMFYAVNLADGKEIWRRETEGYRIELGGKWYYDRKAILASATISGNICVVGGRDGFLYGINKINGEIIWKVDFTRSWVISSVAIKENIVVTGTSDGKFIAGYDLQTGKEIWKFKTNQIIWSSPIIINDLVYLTDCNGILQILNYKTGEKVSEYRTILDNTSIFASTVFTGNSVVYGNDEGELISMKARPFSAQSEKEFKKYVFWQEDITAYFRNGTDVRLKNYFVENGYELINIEKLNTVLTNSSANNSVIAFASNYFPDEIFANEKTSILRKYLDNGGKIIIMGLNPIIPDLKNNKYNFTRARNTFEIDWGTDDLRSFRGTFPAFPTEIGARYSLPTKWTAVAAVDKSQVDVVLGTDENGLASAWIKHYGIDKKGALIQVWVDQFKPGDYNFLKFLKNIE